MAEISFKRGYDVGPAPGLDDVSRSKLAQYLDLSRGQAKMKNGVAVCAVCEHGSFWASDSTCCRCNPRCDLIACAGAPDHPPHPAPQVPAHLEPFRSKCPQCGSVTIASGKPAEVCTAGCGYHFSADKLAPPGKRFEKKCPLCNFVSDRIGSPPTFCVACDSPFEMKKEPAVHCAICNLQAPFVIGRALTSNAFHGKALVPDTDGWSRSFFPWPGKRMRAEAIALPESTWLCPKDATEVAKFIAHRREPMRTEYENLP